MYTFVITKRTQICKEIRYNSVRNITAMVFFIMYLLVLYCGVSASLSCHLPLGLTVNIFLFKDNTVFVLNLYVMSRNINRAKCTGFCCYSRHLSLAQQSPEHDICRDILRRLDRTDALWWFFIHLPGIQLSPAEKQKRKKYEFNRSKTFLCQMRK